MFSLFDLLRDWRKLTPMNSTAMRAIGSFNVSRRASAFAVVLAFGWAVFVGCAGAAESKRFVAYSIRTAQEQVQQCAAGGQDFTNGHDELKYLGGITRPLAIVIDDAGDWILLGEPDAGAPPLTLDDWVAALRARYAYPDEDPGVTIEPRPCPKCPRSKAGCEHSTKQDVRFFAGIDGTSFAATCFEADFLLKKISFGIEQTRNPSIRSEFQLLNEYGGTAAMICSRLWFYPASRVSVASDVIFLEKHRMNVFTEVLSAEIDGRPVRDVSSFSDTASTEFAKSFTDEYDSVAEEWPVFERLRNLSRLSALAKGVLQANRGTASYNYLLNQYPMSFQEIPQEIDIVRVDGAHAHLSGGVRLASLALRFREGDAKALKELVLLARGSNGHSLSWAFALNMDGDQPADISVPIGPSDPYVQGAAFNEALYLLDNGDVSAAIELFKRLLTLLPQSEIVYGQLGYAYLKDGDVQAARGCFDRVVELAPKSPYGYEMRGLALSFGNAHDEAIRELTRAIEIDPSLSAAHFHRGRIQAILGNDELAIKDLTTAISLFPHQAAYYCERAGVHLSGKDFRAARADYDAALKIDPFWEDALLGIGRLYEEQEDITNAFNHYATVLSVRPHCSVAHVRCAFLYACAGFNDKALAEFRQALKMDPGCVSAHLARGWVYSWKGVHTEAIKDYSKAIELDERSIEGYVGRASSYFSLGETYRALEDLDKALELDAHCSDALFHKGIICESIGRDEDAVGAFQSLLDLPESRGLNRERLSNAALSGMGSLFLFACSAALVSPLLTSDNQFAKELGSQLTGTMKSGLEQRTTAIAHEYKVSGYKLDYARKALRRLGRPATTKGKPAKGRRE